MQGEEITDITIHSLIYHQLYSNTRDFCFFNLKIV